MVTFSPSTLPPGRLPAAEAAALLRAAQQPNRDAMEAVYTRYHPFLDERARRELGVRHPYNRAELVEATFDVLFKPSTRYEPLPGASFESFAFRLLRNLHLLHQRQLARREKPFTDCTILGWRRTPLDVIADPNTTPPDEQAQQNESRARLLRLVQALPEKYRLALLAAVARYPDDSRAALAEDLGIANLNSAGTWLCRGRNRLRELLRAERGGSYPGHLTE